MSILLTKKKQQKGNVKELQVFAQQAYGRRNRFPAPSGTLSYMDAVYSGVDASTPPIQSGVDRLQIAPSDPLSVMPKKVNELVVVVSELASKLEAAERRVAELEARIAAVELRG
jgi:hypothetical protein